MLPLLIYPSVHKHPHRFAVRFVIFRSDPPECGDKANICNFLKHRRKNVDAMDKLVS